MRSDEGRAVPNFVDQVKERRDRECEIKAEEFGDELTRGLLLVTDGRNSDPELADEDETVEDEADPGANDAGLRTEGQLTEGVALQLPAFAEADVSETDGGPCKDGTERRKSQHPCEGILLSISWASSKECQKSEHRCDGNSGQRTPLTVDIGQKPRSLMLLCESGKCSTGAVDSRVSDRQDSQHDHGIKDRRKPLDASVPDGDDERRSISTTSVILIEQIFVSIGDKEANYSERDNVKEGDAPEDLLDGSRQRFAWVGSLSGCETDQFGTRKSEGGIDESAAEALEAIVESPGIGPEFAADVAAIRPTADVDDDAQNDEAYYGGNLDDGKYKFGFSVAFDAEEVNGDN